MDTDELVNRPPKQQLVSRLLKRRGIPVREYLWNGYRPLVFKVTECSDHIWCAPITHEPLSEGCGCAYRSRLRVPRLATGTRQRLRAHRDGAGTS